MSNHVDRFYAAVSAVAGHGDIKQRLISAFEEHLAIIENDELPVVIRQDFIALRNLMTGVEPLNGEGRIRAGHDDGGSQARFDGASTLEFSLSDVLGGREKVQIGKTPPRPEIEIAGRDYPWLRPVT